MSPRTVIVGMRSRRRMIGSSMRTSTSPTCDSGMRCPVAPVKREVRDPGRVEPGAAGRTGHDLHRADVLAHGGDRHAAQQELQLLRHRAGGQAHGLQPVLVQGEVQRRACACPSRC